MIGCPVISSPLGDTEIFANMNAPDMEGHDGQESKKKEDAVQKVCVCVCVHFFVFVCVRVCVRSSTWLRQIDYGVATTSRTLKL